MTYRNTGFTLIELLIVIAVVGLLAGAIIVAINPSEQLARARDAERISAIKQLGQGLNAYVLLKGSYPPTSVTWITTVKNSGDLKSEPVNPGGGTGYVSACQQTDKNMNGYCYKINGPDVFVAARVESKSETARAACVDYCAGACGIPQPWIVWSSANNKTGLYCTTNWSYDPVAGMTDIR